MIIPYLIFPSPLLSQNCKLITLPFKQPKLQLKKFIKKDTHTHKNSNQGPMSQIQRNKQLLNIHTHRIFKKSASNSQIKNFHKKKKSSKLQHPIIVHHKIHTHTNKKSSQIKQKRKHKLKKKISGSERKKVVPALQDVGGSFCRSLSSFKIRFDAITYKQTNKITKT